MEGNIFSPISVSSKRGSRIRHLQLESDTSAGQLEADLGALAERALVAAGSEEELDNAGDQEILDGFDLVFVVRGTKFRGHKVIAWFLLHY